MVGEESAAVMPAGRVPTVKVTGELKLFVAAIVSVVLKLAPAVRASEEILLFKVKPGGARTVSSRPTLCDTVPPAADMAILYWPGVTVLGAVTVRVLVPEPGAANVAAEKEPLTQVGRPFTARVTGELKLPVRFLVVRTMLPAVWPA